MTLRHGKLYNRCMRNRKASLFEFREAFELTHQDSNLE